MMGWDNTMEENALYHLYGPQCAWERTLVEIADGIIDVTPLASGYAREAHGRMVFTERKGGLGWSDKNAGGTVEETTNRNRTAASSGASLASSVMSLSSKPPIRFAATVVNFACLDTGVQAIRLRSS